MAARFIGSVVAPVLWPGLSRRCSQHATGLARSPGSLRPLGSNAQPLWRMGQYTPAALGEQLSRSYCSTQSPDVYTAPPQPLAREAPSVGHGFNTLANVKVDLERKELNVSWEGSGAKSQAYPFVWLRDNCHCPQCFHPTALGRLPSSTHHLNVDVIADVVEISADGRSLIVQWDDGHESEFLFHWLGYHRFDQSLDDQLLYPKQSLWGSDVNIKSFDFDELLAEDHSLYSWLAELVTRGVALVKNAPAEVGQVYKLAERVAYLRATTYGATFHVMSKPDPSSVGYTTGPFAMHTDYAPLSRTPGVLLLHCILPAGEGGESLLVDGFKVAQDLKKIDPEAFRLLTTYEFDYSEKGTDCFGSFYMHSRHPVIKLNELGDVEQIVISNQSRDPMLRVPVDQIQPIYHAFNKYFNMLQLPENLLQYKLQKGDILTNDNRRVLHGRNSFQTNARHLEGGYVEWDEVNSRLRALTLQLQKNTTDE
ncbi:gamma-butyrobetaine dioxygenase-like [Patiria miniata]|uniref:Gamma-butyrobetaine dioxygenase n=1 Tax=Patiria miniata TaxID=46514 RepID=A0A914B1H4_PATMI|nr:gamma-butyrobetaine dioxygenase-like [Patiria miniata]XP_038069347.1 gamma-butyrobetaine dioxygenase-like [Patiria miniata]